MSPEKNLPLRIPMSAPDIGDREIDLVNQVLRSPVLSNGPMLSRFEAATARYAGARRAIGVSSGTAGLHLCVVAAGIGSGDEVLTSAFSFVASANCLLYEEALPVFVDIDPLTLNLDPAQLEARITSRTRAILPVHAFGQPAAMDAILDIARRHELLVIEDACEALGSEYRGRRVGALGDAGVFAYYPNKQMTTGEGGMVVTGREDWGDLFASLRNQGRDVFDAWLNHSRLGFNYRMDEMSAALGVAQMERIEELLAKRQRVADLYTERLSSWANLAPPYISPDTTRMSWFVYWIRMGAEINRATVMQLLLNRGVPSRPYFSPIHLQPVFRERFGYQPGMLPMTERAAQQILALPFHANLTVAEVEYVVEQLREVLPLASGRKAGD